MHDKMIPGSLLQLGIKSGHAVQCTLPVTTSTRDPGHSLSTALTDAGAYDGIDVKGLPDKRSVQDNLVKDFSKAVQADRRRQRRRRRYRQELEQHQQSQRRQSHHGGKSSRPSEATLSTELEDSASLKTKSFVYEHKEDRDHCELRIICITLPNQQALEQVDQLQFLTKQTSAERASAAPTATEVADMIPKLHRTVVQKLR